MSAQAGLENKAFLIMRFTKVLFQNIPLSRGEEAGPELFISSGMENQWGFKRTYFR